jgi:transcriptional regulator with XRE-family HTH domain
MVIDRSMTDISPALCRAARALLGWKQSDLAEKAEVSIGTIRDFEADARKLHKNNARAIQRSFEEAGVAFLEQAGVAFRKSSDEIGVVLSKSLDEILRKSFDEYFKKLERDETFLLPDQRAKVLVTFRKLFDENLKRLRVDFTKLSDDDELPGVASSAKGKPRSKGKPPRSR